MARVSTLYIEKQAHKFSAAHYTIFSASERERLHGHNYAVSARIVAETGDNGFAADYNVYKANIASLCHELDEYMLLASQSPHQTIEEQGDYYRVRFADDEMLFLKSDTLVLPLRNTTIEELSTYLLGKLVGLSATEGIVELQLYVSSGPGQKASSCWRCGSGQG